MYTRVNNHVFFILPAIACGVDLDGTYFIEVAWFNFAVGVA